MPSTAALLWLSGLLWASVCLQPGVVCENLTCFFCPVTSVSSSCEAVLSECRPQDQCYTSAGRSGRQALLFSKGCMSGSDCVRPKTSVFRRINVTFTYSCCGRDFCNSGGACGPALALTALSVLETLRI